MAVLTKSQAQTITGSKNKMARTIRTKVYQFNELDENSKAIAIVNEAMRFNLYFTGRQKKEYNHHELDAAKDRLIDRKCEFTADGRRF